ncbi:MAG: hypothetical protein Kow0092_35280 [Deferrisomatales bacterium]
MPLSPRRPRSARFLASLPRWKPSPVTGWPQVAVAGRSNVGKSSLINALLGRKGLARTSSTPGRTQMLNFFLVDERFALVDLPGYGFARAPVAVVRRWTEDTRRFIDRSPSLQGVVILLDVRRDPSPEDLAFIRWVRRAGRPLEVAVTKCDKISRGRRAARLAAIGEAVEIAPERLIPTSARTGEGCERLWQRIVELADGAARVGEADDHEEGREDMTVRVIAIDGPSGAGKSTVARRLAARLGWSYIDTGAMYRAVGLKAERAGVPLTDDEALEELCRHTRIELARGEEGEPRVLLDGEDVSEAIREHRVSDLASRVSARAPVRRAMARYQRELGCRQPSVLEGRDIGTVVFPDAFLKVFLTASDRERARRRTEELHRRGQPAAWEAVLEDIRARDRADSEREHAPLRAAPDAVAVDTTELDVDQVVDRLAALAAEKLRSPPGSRL